MALGPPATRTECYLAAILDELRALRVAVEGGGPQVDADPPGMAAPVPADGVGEAPAAAQAPTKRTRQRPPRKN